LENGEYVANPHMRALVERENLHELEIAVHRSDTLDTAIIPVFKSTHEAELYKLLVGLFPNHLVIPNTCPNSFLRYATMKERLDKETFEYYLKCEIDFLVVSTANYLPLLVIELDSHYHDQPEAQARDQKKNEIMRAGGVDLMRVRARGEPTPQQVRADLHKAVQANIEVLRRIGLDAGDFLRSQSGSPGQDDRHM
jgi:very-short-patch-repair endonuclease